MRRVDIRAYAVWGHVSGRHYRIDNEYRHRGAREGYWYVCEPGGGHYAIFATLPAARAWALAH